MWNKQLRTKITLKDHEQEQQLFNGRILVCTFILLLLAIILAIRLAYLQIFQHDTYTTLSKQNQLALVPIEPARGLIFDRKGMLLADNIPSFSLEIVPEHTSKLKETIASLQRIVALNEDDIKTFYKQLKQHRRFESVPLKLKLTEEELAHVSVDQFLYPGTVIKPHLTRRYPLKDLASEVLGYVGRINPQEAQLIDKKNYSSAQFIGKVGLEKFYEDTLHGTVGYQQIETDASGRTVRVLKRTPPIAGENLYLTLDGDLQRVAKQAFGEEHGSLVAINPNNGEVLALVSLPSFDPNLFANGIDNKAYTALQHAPERPLYNRAIRGLYPPASTFKPFMALLGLGSGAVTEQDYIDDPGWYKLRNSSHVYRDWKLEGHGQVNVTRAIFVSCDTYFYNLATKVGIRAIGDMMRQFGFGKVTGIEMKEESAGLVPTPEWKRRMYHQSWYPGDTVITGIGQGFSLVTPLQLAGATAALANHGKRFQIHLLSYRKTDDGKVTPYIPQELASVNYPQHAWDIVFEGMQDVVLSTEGTAARKFGQDSKYSIAAKTGTAQVVRKPKDKKDIQNSLPKHLRNHSLFIAFAPLEKPQIALAIIVEHNTEGLAARIARQVLDYHFFKKKPTPPSTMAKPKVAQAVNEDVEEEEDEDDESNSGEEVEEDASSDEDTATE